jgi:hypothetical protein
VQIRLTSPSRHLTLRPELIKSAIVTALWLWLLVSSVVGYWGNPYYKLVNCTLSFLFIWSVYLPNAILPSFRDFLAGGSEWFEWR